jgi:hypothetical protein
MERKQLTTGLSEIGLGVILFITTLELPSIISSDGMMEVFTFFIRVLSYISIVIGCITTIMAVLPESVKSDTKLEDEDNKKKS